MLAEGVPPPPRPLALVPVGPEAEARALALAHELRRAGHVVDLGYRGSLGRRMRRADRINAVVALILGGDELAKRVVQLRELDSGVQREVALDALPAALAPYRDADRCRD
jgi:histidyl-tRNA synthetase